jgi:hypothetical protein
LSHAALCLKTTMHHEWCGHVQLFHYSLTIHMYVKSWLRACCYNSVLDSRRQGNLRQDACARDSFCYRLFLKCPPQAYVLKAWSTVDGASGRWQKLNEVVPTCRK